MPRLSKKTMFAIEAVLDVAFHVGEHPVRSGDITERQRIPKRYLEQVLQHLVRAGILNGKRGPRGGYRLTRTPSEISFGEIVRAMEGPIALVSCASVNFYAPCGDCHDEATCAIRRAFAILRDQSTSVLDSISLAQGAGWEERLEK